MRWADGTGTLLKIDTGLATTNETVRRNHTDVDSPDGGAPRDRTRNRHASTLIEYYGTHGQLLFTSNAPASPGDGNLSFIGVVFGDARVARVRIIAGDVAPEPNDDRKDIVMMDDFLYGEPTPLY